MMISDAPRYVGRKEGKSSKTAEEEATDVANFFRSKLKA